MVEVLADADATVTERAVSGIMGMSTLAACADAESLLAALPPPEDPEDAAAVERARGKLVRASTLRAYRRSEEGDALALEVLETARALEYRPLLAEAQLEQSSALAAKGDFKAAAELTESTYYLAEAAGHDEVRATMAIQLIKLLGVYQPRVPEAERWAKHARALVERLAPSFPDLPPKLHRVEGILANHTGDHELARVKHEQALAADEAQLGADDLIVADDLNNLATALSGLGRNEEAERTLRRALAISESLLGAEHPNGAGMRSNLASFLMYQGELERAEQEARLSVELIERARGAEHPALLSPLVNLGGTLERAQKYAQAREVQERALALSERVNGPEHPTNGAILYNLGVVIVAQKDDERAEQHLLRSVEIWEKVMGPKFPHIALSLTKLGDIERRRGEHKTSRARLERAVTMLTETPIQPEFLAEAQFALARTLDALGREGERARALARDSQRGYAESGGYPRELAEVERWIERHAK